MESKLQDAMRTAAEALNNMAEEAGKLTNELLALQARADRQDEFNLSMKRVFDEYYGG